MTQPAQSQSLATPQPQFDPNADPNAGLIPANNRPPAPAPEKIGSSAFKTNLSDDTVKQFEFDLYSGRTGQTDRIYLIRPLDIIKARYHYHDKLKYIACNSEYEIKGNQELMTREGECCKRLGKNNLRFGVLILRYVTEKNGALVKPFIRPEARLWKFGVDKFIDLRQINSDYPLDKFDLAVTCTDEKYQKLTLGAKPECIYTLAGFPQELKTVFEAWADASMPKIAREMARPMTDEEILRELGMAGPAPANMQASDAPITNFGDVIGAMK